MRFYSQGGKRMPGGGGGILLRKSTGGSLFFFCWGPYKKTSDAFFEKKGRNRSMTGAGNNRKEGENHTVLSFIKVVKKSRITKEEGRVT